MVDVNVNQLYTFTSADRQTDRHTHITGHTKLLCTASGLLLARFKGCDMSDVALLCDNVQYKCVYNSGDIPPFPRTRLHSHIMHKHICSPTNAARMLVLLICTQFESLS